MRWTGIPLPGATVRAGVAINPDTAARVSIAPEFVMNVLRILSAGSTLYVTDSPVLPETTGPSLNVLNADPPAKPAP
jgi:hypothetical protein